LHLHAFIFLCTARLVGTASIYPPSPPNPFATQSVFLLDSLGRGPQLIVPFR
jgi:hypothetical protein